MKLSNESLYEISGGGLSKAALTALAAVGIFLVGVIDGIMRPLKCNK
jgi:hypothetical protein